MKGMYITYKESNRGKIICRKVLSEPYTKARSSYTLATSGQAGSVRYKEELLPMQNSYTVILLDSMKELEVSRVLEISDQPISIPEPVYMINIKGIHPHSPSGVASCFKIYLKDVRDVDKILDSCTDYLFAEQSVETCYNGDYLKKVEMNNYFLKSDRACNGVPRFPCTVSDHQDLIGDQGYVNILEFLKPIIKEKEL